MRPVLFRGKVSDPFCRIDNQWITGSLVEHFRNQSTTYTISEPAIEAYGTFSVPCQVEKAVDPNTIGQFTGVYDYNDNPIYEDDIVLVSGDGELLHEGIVVFRNGAFWISVPGFDDFPLCSYFEKNQESIVYELSVTGNVHDNPDLVNELMK